MANQFRVRRGVLRGALSSVLPGQTGVAALCCVLGAGSLAGCSSDSPSAAASAGAGGHADATATAGSAGTAGVSLESVTFHRDVEPILQRSCQGCHVPGGIAPFSLLSYAEARLLAPRLAQQTRARSMPPWHAENTDECSVRWPWKNDTRLTEREIATFQAWLDAGMPEGDMKDAPPPFEPAPGLRGVQLELKPELPFALAPGADQFRCFVLDPKLDQDSFVNGVFVVPGNPAVVHHVLVFSDPTRASLANLSDGSPSYDCFGGARVSGSELLTAWTPGGLPLEYPANIAAPVAAGSLLVMQVHYHPHSESEVASDATRLQLRFSSAAPEYRAISALLGNFRSTLANGDGLLPGPNDPAAGPAFLIPAGAVGHTETMSWTFRPKVGQIAPKLYGIGGHMHYVGVDEKVTLTRADGTNECLLHIPHWDFDWQRLYEYDAAIAQLPELNPGDQLGIRCTYDNTMANEKVAASLLERGLSAPRPVTLGESTLDEMCLVSLTALYPTR